MSVLADLVVLLPSLPVRVDVNHHPTHVREVVEELVPNLLRDLVARRASPLQADLWITAPKVNQLGRALWLTGADMLSAKSRSTTATDLSWNFAD